MVEKEWTTFWDNWKKNNKKFVQEVDAKTLAKIKQEIFNSFTAKYYGNAQNDLIHAIIQYANKADDLAFVNTDAADELMNFINKAKNNPKITFNELPDMLKNNITTIITDAKNARILGVSVDSPKFKEFKKMNVVDQQKYIDDVLKKAANGEIFQAAVKQVKGNPRLIQILQAQKKVTDWFTDIDRLSDAAKIEAEKLSKLYKQRALLENFMGPLTPVMKQHFAQVEARITAIHDILDKKTSEIALKYKQIKNAKRTRYINIRAN